MRLKPTIVLGRFDERPFSRAHLLRSPNFWLLLLFSLIYFSAYQYCRLAFARDPTSFFFNPTKGYQRHYSLKREGEAQSYIKSANGSGTAPPKSSTKPLFCIAIATIARSGDQYVRNAVGSLFEGLSSDQRQSIHLAILIAQTDPEEHPIYHEPWLRVLANSVVTYDPSKTGEIAQLQHMEEVHAHWNKSMWDYIYLLETCESTGAQWIITVEDDVIAVQNWYTQATNALQAIQAQTWHSDLLYLRMFYTEKLFGWNSEEWSHYLVWSLLIFSTVAALLIGLRSRSPHLRRHMSNLSIGLICLICLPACIVLYFMAGRVSMQPHPRGLQRMEDFGCCSQGLIYPREIIPRVKETVRGATNQRYYVDMTLERWANTQKLARFALVPPLLQHVGSQSSKGHDFDEGAESIWNFEFENYR